jgi:repressor LexA
MLTPKQLKLFKFIKKYKKNNELMPTFNEMKNYMDVKSKSTVHHMLSYMEWKGYIKRYPAMARAIETLR